MAARRVYFTTEEVLAFVNKDNSATESDRISEESDSDNESNHFDKCLTDESAGGGNISEIASTTPIETYESDDASKGSTAAEYRVIVDAYSSSLLMQAPVGDEIQHGCSSKEANILERSDFLYASSEEDGLPEIEDHSDVDLGCISESSSSSAVSTFSAQDVGTGHSWPEACTQSWPEAFTQSWPEAFTQSWPEWLEACTQSWLEACTQS